MSRRLLHSLLVASGAAALATSTGAALAQGPALVRLAPIPATYHGAPDAVQRVASAAPRALAVADLDGDGAPEVVAGYADGQGGLLVIHRGNLEAYTPTRDASISAAWRGATPGPLVGSATVVEVPEPVDRVVIGDFDGDGLLDVAAAARGAHLWILKGQGGGQLGAPKELPLEGRVTALAAGDVDVADGVADLLVGVTGDVGAQVLVFRSDRGGTAAPPLAYPLGAPATDIAAGPLDDDRQGDFVVAAGDSLVLVHGSRGTPADPASRLETISVGTPVQALAFGRFTGTGPVQLAALTSSGAVALLRRPDAPLPATVATTVLRQPVRPAAPDWAPGGPTAWTVAGTLGQAGAGADTLVAARLGGASDELLSGGRAVVPQRLGAAGPRALSPDSSPAVSVAVLPATFSGITRVVTLSAGQASPGIITSIPQTLTVDRTDDPAVTTAGTGAAACTAAANDCSLRGAVLVANANPGSTINLPAGTYSLTIDGTSEAGNCTTATVGDLDIAGNNTSIVGAGAATTIIQQTMPSDRVMCVDQDLVGNFTFSLSGVTITGGRETFGVGGGGVISGGVGDVTNVTSVVFSNNQASGGGSPVGGGLGNGAGGVTVSGSTFGGSSAPCVSQATTACANQSTGSGAGFYFSNNNIADTRTLTLGTSTFTNNVSVGGNGGGLLTTQASSAYSVTNSTFTGNQSQGSNGRGGGIYNESGTLNASTNTFTGNQATGAGGAGNAFGSSDGPSHNITATFNRIVGNSGSASDVAAGTGSTNTMPNNWWGCNGGPGAAGCDTVGGGGTNTFSPWIVLKTTPSPNPINYGQSTTLTASFLQNSSGGVLTAGQIATLIGLPVTWANAAHGALSGQQATIQASGTATATFTAGSTSPDCGNVGAAEAKVDGIQDGDAIATAAITINCPDFTLSKTNNVSGTTTLGSNWTWTLTESNGGPGFGTFSNGQTILTDNLPNANVAYGSVTTTPVSGITGTISCSVNGTFDLTCTASGTVQINAGGSFTASLSATPAVVGTYANPRPPGTAAIDPGNNVPETSDANNTASNSVLVTAPDLTGSKANNVSSAALLGGSWNWTVTVSNTGTAAAGFTAGQTIVADDLPTAGLSYGTPTPGSFVNVTNPGNISCAVVGNTLSCSATGSVSLGAATGSFAVVLPVTPTAIGTYTNPRAGGAASVDPGSVVTESNEANNAIAANSVTVTAPDLTLTKTDDVSGASAGNGGWTWKLHVANAAGAATATFATTQAIVLDNLPNAGLTYGAPGVVNATGLTGTVSCSIVSSDLTCTASGPVTLAAGGGFDVTFTATPSAVGAFANPRGGGTAQVDPSNVAPESNEGNNTASDSVTVTKADTTAAIVSDTPDPTVPNQPFSVSYTVSVNAPGGGVPTGTVTVLDGASVVCTGSVAAGSCTGSLAVVGPHTLTATYGGDALYNASPVSAGASHTVSKADTTTTAVDTPDPSVVGESITVSYTVTAVAPGSGTPTGSVTVSDGAGHTCTGTVAAGQCTLSIPGAGSVTLTATYSGDADFNGSSGSALHTVNPGNTTTSITGQSQTTTVVGESFTVNYVVAPVLPASGTITGTVTVSDGSTSNTCTVAAGACTLTLSTVGGHTITATYNGDANFNGSTSVGAGHTVTQVATSTTITSTSPNPSNPGQSVSISYVVAVVAPGTGTPTGNVTVSDGVNNCTATVAAGNCAIAFPTSGPHVLTATYAGDVSFAGSTSPPVTQTVRFPNDTAANAKPVFVGSTSSDLLGAAPDDHNWFRYPVQAGRSYCVEVDNGKNDTTMVDPALGVFHTDGITAIGSNDNIADEPGGPLLSRVCYIAGVTEDNLADVTAATAGPTAGFRLRVVDTTLFSPFFFSGNGYEAFILVKNTTRVGHNVTVTLLAAGGTPLAAPQSGLAPADGCYALKVSSAPPTGFGLASASGSLQIAHDGPPGALISSVLSINFDAGTSFDSPVGPRQRFRP